MSALAMGRSIQSLDFKGQRGRDKSAWVASGERVGEREIDESRWEEARDIPPRV